MRQYFKDSKGSEFEPTFNFMLELIQCFLPHPVGFICGRVGLL